MNAEQTEQFVNAQWDTSIVATLMDYIRIPNKSPMFDADWQAHGHMEAAVELLSGWCRAHMHEDMQLEVVRLPGRTPLLLVDIPGRGEGNVLLYGHLDKQPEMSGWREGFGPWQPVIEDERLYGRGGADDGYALFASLAAILALREQGVEHARCLILIEACEESGSYDLPHYIAALRERIGQPELVICLDSGCGNYEQLWSTTSLRGLVGGTLSIDMLREGVHSGDASGVVASTFRIARQLLSRLEDEHSGAIDDAVFNAEVPAERQQQARTAGQVLGKAGFARFPFVDGGQPTHADASELVLNRTWRPALSITGAGGLPRITDAGNVCRPRTELKLSLRLPPTVDADQASQHLKALLEKDPPYGAQVVFEPDQIASGWNAPALAEWLEQAVDTASREFFGKPAVYMGEGGSIPFMDMLGREFPDAQFLISGVLGPQSNAHGPNEFLHLPTARRLTCCVASVLTGHAARQAPSP